MNLPGFFDLDDMNTQMLDLPLDDVINAELHFLRHALMFGIQKLFPGIVRQVEKFQDLLPAAPE